MARRVLTDDIWLQIQDTMKFYGCYRSKNSKNIMEAILWKLRTGATWRDIPEDLCPWQTAYNRFNRWAIKGLWGQVFFKLRGVLDTERVFIDGSYVRAHQHASGARRGEARAIGRSRGGATTKIHLAVDANGHPLDFEITGGETHDSQVAPQLIALVQTGHYLVADKGYDSEKIRESSRKHGMIPVIPRKSNSTKSNPEFSRYLYGLRYVVENAFARLKHFRGIATRFDKLARNYKAMLRLACIFIWCKAK
ncbi:IS5 family transposase [Vitreoscilla massiliensis]|uniref:IS5 family transposase n=1 Tax=Vitreoscilla massiliensis TaxID=1689272 RepID=A0ABY4E1H5_9NEIS|nr:IS5 family transposase [Vitreoscilla massiliensis]UOO88264.1 IS5 family transposase [Vitreoscilla massiliensis]UOO88635.1 IS5 family transposase [Vitreoscilla massiliensis]UOO88848.1 IS5 family transposase [Vitreoscilla massiliensis]UOO90088.1 IS5 family transposase [Vitreoscilla massiliensis]UOO90375.1 IS5 family transposase [Vitreoscilla massiliensis]